MKYVDRAVFQTDVMDDVRKCKNYESCYPVSFETMVVC